MLCDDGQDAAGDEFFGAGDSVENFAGGREDLDFVIGRADGLGAVGNHEIAEFAFELGECAETVVFGFEREADDPAMASFRSKRGHDIVGFDEPHTICGFDGETATTPKVLTGWSSKTAVQVVPLLVFFQSPPLALAT